MHGNQEKQVKGKKNRTYNGGIGNVKRRRGVSQSTGAGGLPTRALGDPLSGF